VAQGGEYTLGESSSRNLETGVGSKGKSQGEAAGKERILRIEKIRYAMSRDLQQRELSRGGNGEPSSLSLARRGGLLRCRGSVDDFTKSRGHRGFLRVDEGMPFLGARGRA